MRRPVQPANSGKTQNQGSRDPYAPHTNAKGVIQKVYQYLASYHTDDEADELGEEPVFTTILGKKWLLSTDLFLAQSAVWMTKPFSISKQSTKPIWISFIPCVPVPR
jgi:hypothetical protein